MNRPEKKPKHLIPRRAQIPLVVIGIPLLVFAMLRMAKDMGWIQTVPKAKQAVAKKAPEAPTTGGATTPASGPTQPSRPSGMVAGPTGLGPGVPAPSVDTIALPPNKDPLTELHPATTTPPGAAPGVKPPPAPTTPRNPPPLPPPLPAPVSATPFPSPTTGGSAALPPAMTSRPAQRPLPAALAVNYPLVRRGGGPLPPASVSLVGTISGQSRSLAVIRRAGAQEARGRYVRPGESLDREGNRVKAIGSGRITVMGRGGTRELGLPPPQSSATSASAAKPTKGQPRKVVPPEEASPAPTPVPEEETGSPR